METINYQLVLDLAIVYTMISIPIGLVLGITVKLSNMFISFVTGDKHISL